MGTTLLGSDHNDTVSTTATIQRGSCCILEDGERSDVTRVDRADRTGIECDTIHYVQRRTIRRNRSDTTNIDRGYRTRLTSGVNHLNTSYLTGHSLGNIGGVLLLNVLCLNGFYRTGKAALADVTVTGNNHLFEQLSVLTKHNLQILACSNFLLLHSHEGNDQGLHRSGNVHLELTIDIRSGTDSSALGNDAGADNRLALFVLDDTANLLLRIHCQSCCYKQ